MVLVAIQTFLDTQTENTRNDILTVASTLEESQFINIGENNSRKTGGSVAALKELVCTFFDC